MNVNRYESKKLKEVMDKENVTWRSTAENGQIAPKWNQPGTPVYYVIDKVGIIRYKWVGYPGEKAIDSALEKVVQEIESGKSH